MLSKTALKREIRRFLLDAERGISMEHFAFVAGIDRHDMKRIFVDETMPLSEAVQRKVDRAYTIWKAGGLRVMQMRGRRWPELRHKPAPPIRPALRLTVSQGAITLRVQPANRHDYSQPTLAEALEKS